MMAASHADEFAGVTCTAPAARSDRMRDIVAAHVPRDRAVRLLDLGCGTGSLLFRLADAFPDAELVGVDVSAANIAAARREQERRRLTSPRLAFERVDYLQFSAEPFDAIVSDGVLHLVAADTIVLAAKLASDLRPGGVLVCGMPYDCAYNRVFAATRRFLRTIRAPWLDAAILQAGRILHGREMDDAGLRERVGYMYMPPQRMIGRRLIGQFAAAGLEAVAEYPMASTSLSQLRHRVTIFQRRGGDGVR